MTNRLLEQTLRPMPVPDLLRERIEQQVRDGQIALHQAGLTDRYGRWIWVPEHHKERNQTCASTSP